MLTVAAATVLVALSMAILIGSAGVYGGRISRMRARAGKWSVELDAHITNSALE